MRAWRLRVRPVDGFGRSDVVRSAVARADRDRARPRDRPPARLEVRDQPRAAARRAGRRSRHGTAGAAQPRRRPDGGRAARARRHADPSDESASSVDWTSCPARSRGGARIDVGLAGTVMRFVPPVAALADGEVSLRRRPARPQAPDGPDARRAARASAPTSTGDALPFTVRGPAPRRRGHARRLGSSQFVSGLLLAARPVREGRRRYGTPARRCPSQPHIEMTVADAARGRRRGSTTASRDVWRVEPGPIARQRRDRRARPVERGAVPRRGASSPAARSPSRTGRRSTTQPGDALRGLLTDDGRHGDPRRPTGLTGDRHRPDRTASTPTCTTWAS